MKKKVISIALLMSCTESLYTAEGVGPRRKTSAETVRSGRVTMPANSSKSHSTEYSFGEEDKQPTVVATAGVSQQSARPALGLPKDMTRRQFTNWGEAKAVPSLTGNNTVARIDRSCQQTPEYTNRTETTYRPVAEHYSKTQPYRDTLNKIGCLFPLPPQKEEDLQKETFYAGIEPATGKKIWCVAPEGALIQALKKALTEKSSATTTTTTAPQTAKKASDETWEQQILTILHSTDDDATKRRHISALFIQEERDELNAKLPPELQLSKTSAALAHLSVLSLTGAANRIPKQLGKNLTALTGNRTTTVNDLVHRQLTVANATGPYEPTNATHTILTDRTPQQAKIEAIVLRMIWLQQLRDAQLAYENGGTAEDLVNAIFAPEEQRAQRMLDLVVQLKEAAKEASGGKECLDSGDPKTSHSLVLVEKTYKHRIHHAQLRGPRTSAISFQKPTTSTPYLAVQQPVNGAPEEAGSQNSSSTNALSSSAAAPTETTNS